MKRFLTVLFTLKLTFLLALVTLLVSSETVTNRLVAPMQSPTPVVDDAIERRTSEPYTGSLSIFEDADRDKNLQIDRVMDILKISEGKSVADIGAGSGWFTVRAAKRVGPTAKVFAVEINQEYIDHISARAKREGFLNITTVLGRVDDPSLPPKTIDAVLILKTYHEIAEPIRFMKNLRKAVKVGGLVGIIDRGGNGEDHGLDSATIVKEMKQAGFTLKEQYDFVKPDKMDYFLVFEPSL